MFRLPLASIRWAISFVGLTIIFTGSLNAQDRDIMEFPEQFTLLPRTDRCRVYTSFPVAKDAPLAACSWPAMAISTESRPAAEPRTEAQFTGSAETATSRHWLHSTAGRETPHPQMVNC